MAVNTLKQLPFSKVHVHDVVGRRGGGGVDNRSNLDINEFNKADYESNDRYDQSLLSNIDPDINFFDAIQNAKSRYYYDKQFSANYKQKCNVLLLNTNICSILHSFKNNFINNNNNIYLSQLSQIIEDFSSPYVYICGDFNANAFSHSRFGNEPLRLCSDNS